MKYELILGDTLAKLKSLKSNCINCTITSPPYNMRKSYEESTTLDTYKLWMQDIINELYRVTDTNGLVWWQVGYYTDEDTGEYYPLDVEFIPLFRDAGFKLINRLVWYARHGIESKRFLSRRHETVLLFAKGDDYKFDLDPIRIKQRYPGKVSNRKTSMGKILSNPKGKNPSDVLCVDGFENVIHQEFKTGIIDIPQVKYMHPEYGEKGNHPCAFPLELVLRLLLTCTDEDDVVLDPFMGTGTSVLAAITIGRIGVGIDNVQEYIEIAESRIQKYKEGVLPCRLLGTPIQKPSGEMARSADGIQHTPDVFTMQLQNYARAKIYNKIYISGTFPNIEISYGPPQKTVRHNCIKK